MKAFDLGLAMKGHPICNRHGEPVRFVAYVADVARHERVVVVSDGEILTHNENGCFLRDESETGLDLFMVESK